MMRRVPTALATALALACPLASGALPPGLAAALLAPLVYALRGRALIPAWVGTTGIVLALLWAGVGIAEQGVGVVVVSLTSVLMLTLAARLLTANAHRHEQQALLLSLLLVFAASALHRELSFVPLFLLFVWAELWALMAGVDQRVGQPVEAKLSILARTAAWATAALLLTSTAIFLVFPRFGSFQVGLVAHQGTLPNNVALSAPPRALGEDETVVARIRGLSRQVFAGGLYLRGPVYDRITPAGFSKSHVTGGGPYGGVLYGQETFAYDVFLHPVHRYTLFTLGSVDTLNIQNTSRGASVPDLRYVGIDPRGEHLLSDEPVGPVRYLVQGAITKTGESLPKERRVRMPRLGSYGDVPVGLDPRIAAQALALVTDDMLWSEKSAALREYLRREFRYTLDLSERTGEATLDDFFFVDRRGHCEYFATAFAVMLRAIGLGSRVVGGFHGGAWDPQGALIVFRAKDAHVWVEWFHPQFGWVADDATPAALTPPSELSGWRATVDRWQRRWDEYVLDYGLTHQVALASRAAAALGALGAVDIPFRRAVRFQPLVGTALAVVGLFVAVRLWLWRTSRRKLSKLGQALLATIEAVRGRAVAPHETLRESVPAGWPAIMDVVLVYERAVFGAHRHTGPQVSQALASLRAARKRS